MSVPFPPPELPDLPPGTFVSAHVAIAPSHPKVGDEILVMRWLVGVAIQHPVRCIVTDTRARFAPPSFEYKLDEGSEQGTRDVALVEDDGTLWINGWDEESRGALLAGWALRDRPDPMGAQGPVGPTGVQGRTGPTGAQSAAPTGPQGLTGARGAQGPTGVQGSAGAHGIAGPQGVTGWPTR
jgi:hypothetical protein